MKREGVEVHLFENLQAKPATQAGAAKTAND